MKTHSPSVKTFGFATFLPEEGKGLYNNSELRITNSAFRVSAKPQFIIFIYCVFVIIVV
jgi:hypothetical protein